MAGLGSWDIDDREEGPPTGLQAHQLKAAAAPDIPLKQLAREDLSGNFKDLEGLLEQLGSAPLFELGKPLPNQKFMPRRRVGKCPAAHNRALLDEDAD
jgi:hypothetical protein